MHPPVSVVSSLKLLSGSKWQYAYEILLRFKSEERCTQLPSQSVIDIANALRLVGKNDTADRIDELVSYFRRDDPLLQLLVELANNPLARCDGNRSVFAMANDNILSGVEELSNPFSFDATNSENKCVVNQSLGADDWLSQAASSLLQSGDEVLQTPSSSMKLAPIVQAEPCNRYGAKRTPEISPQDKPRTRESSCGLPSLHLVVFTLLNPSPEVTKSGPQGNPNRSQLDPVDRQCYSEMKRLLSNYFSTWSNLASQERNTVITVPEPPDSFLLGVESTTSETLLKRARYYGELYRSLSSFSTAYSNGTGRVLSAVAEFSGELAHRYHARILQVLARVERGNRNVALHWDVLYAAEAAMKDAIHVVRLLSEIEQTSGCANAILNVITDALPNRLFCPKVRDLFYAALSPYLELIFDWVFMASASRDVGLEFFGSTLGDKAKDSEELLAFSEFQSLSGRDTNNKAAYPDFLTKQTASFILRSGRSRALLEVLSPNHSVLGIQQQTKFGRLNALQLSVLAANIHASVSKEGECDSENENSSDETDMLTSPSNDDNTSSKPDDSGFFWFPPEHPKSLFHPEQLNFHLPREDESDTLCSELKSFEGEAVESPVALFDRFIVKSLRTLDLLIQKEILRYYVHELNVFEHLRVLGDYALLGAGDFAHVLVCRMNEAEIISRDNELFINRRVQAARTFYGSAEAGRATWRVQRHLAECFRGALNASFAEQRPYIEYLSIGVGEWTEDTESLWKQSLEVCYEVGFPLDMVISPSSLSLYSKFFNFFLSVHRARKCLGSLYFMTRRRRSSLYPRNGKISSRVRHYVDASLMQFSIHADHFVSIIGGYQFNQLHGIGWHDFEASWSSVCSIWDLCNEHTSFLMNTLRTTLLAEKQAEVLRVIVSAFESIYVVEAEVSRFIEAISLTPRATPFKKLYRSVTLASQRLRKSSRFLVVVLEKLCALDSNDHLNDFLTRLNFNGYYDTNRHRLLAGDELNDEGLYDSMSERQLYNM